MKKILFFTLCFILLTSNIAFGSFNEVDDDAWNGVVSYVDDNYPNLPENEKKTLKDNLYNERITHENIVYTDESLKSNKEIDEAYETMMKEETYVVALINHRGGSATLSSWEDNLKFLIDHYDEIKSDSAIDLDFVDSYIHAYNIVKKCENLPENKSNNIETLSTSYDYDAAVAYAYRWWDGHNPNFSNWDGFGGDCANFASQCLYAGGKPMEGTNRESTSAWFSRTTDRNDLNNLSDTWIDAGSFRWYWQDHASSYRTFARGGIDSYNYTWPGDAISFLNTNNRAYHTLLCVDYDSSIRETYMACHSSARNDRPLSTVTNSFIVYNMS